MWRLVALFLVGARAVENELDCFVSDSWEANAYAKACPPEDSKSCLTSTTVDSSGTEVFTAKCDRRSCDEIANDFRYQLDQNIIRTATYTCCEEVLCNLPFKVKEESDASVGAWMVTKESPRPEWIADAFRGLRRL